MFSRTKSVGRFARSVEMITQRPTIGSFLSSGTSANPFRGLAQTHILSRQGGASTSICGRGASTVIVYAYTLEPPLPPLAAAAADSLPLQLRHASTQSSSSSHRHQLDLAPTAGCPGNSRPRIPHSTGRQKRVPQMPAYRSFGLSYRRKRLLVDAVRGVDDGAWETGAGVTTNPDERRKRPHV